MRIAIAIATLGGGGAERQIAYLAPALAALGHQVHVIHCEGGPNMGRLCDAHVVLHRVGVYPFARRAFGPIVATLRSVAPDIVYLWQRPFVVTGAIAAAAVGIPFVLAERTDPRRVASGPKFAGNWLAAQGSSGVIANSEAGRDYWRRNLWGRDRSWHVPNAIPAQELRAVSADPQCAGEIICAGRLDHNKNVIGLIEAAAVARRRGWNVRLAFAGDGPLLEDIAGRIAQYDLGDCVRLLGFQTDLWPLLKGARGLVSLSRSEGSPNAVLEAAALGLPMILSDIPAHAVIAAAYPAARIVDGEDADAVAAAMCDIDAAPVQPCAAIDGVFAPPLDIAARHVAIFERTLGMSFSPSPVTHFSRRH